ncbi:MAG: 3-phosphoshikimate 1-carboxyvinyltransferase, partial [Ardenticatenaceae bacterium]
MTFTPHKTLVVRPAHSPLRGEVGVPGDKSISHRVLLFGALAEGETRAIGWLPAEDCLATVRVLRALRVKISFDEPTSVRVQGVGLQGLREPEDALDCGGSGTTMRLLAGILAGQPFTSIMTGNAALRRRPMGRIAVPLRAMGAEILSREMDGQEKPPLAIRGGGLRAIEYVMPMASAQVKSALLLAGLFAGGTTLVQETGPARDHTERLLRAMGAPLRVEGSCVSIESPREPLRPLGATNDGVNVPGQAYRIPGDLSSAAFPLVAATLVRNSAVRLANVGVNPTRTGLLDMMGAMGVELRLEKLSDTDVEPTADLIVQGTELSGIEVGGEWVVRSID